MDFVYALDVSNYQPDAMTTEGLSALIQRTGLPIGLIVIRGGLGCEPPNLRQIAQAQIQTTLALGIPYALYGWAYPAYGPDSVVYDLVSQWQEVTQTPPVFYAADLEDAGACDWAAWIAGYQAACAQYQLPRWCIYTGTWWAAQHLAGVDLTGISCWLANYTGAPDLTLAAPCGMTLIGHQWSDKSPSGEALDMDAFLPDALGLCA